MYRINDIAAHLLSDRDLLVGPHDEIEVARQWIDAGVDIFGWTALGVYTPEAARRLERAGLTPADVSRVDDPDLFSGFRPGYGVASGDVSIREIEAALAEHLLTDRDLLLVEVMPCALRASHEAARNSGQWPHNGARRYLVSRDAADALVDGEWTAVVRDARPDDLDDYELDLDGERTASA